MPELKRLGEITYDKDSESIAIVHLAYSTREITTHTEGNPVEKELLCDHEGNTKFDTHKLAEHLNEFLLPKIKVGINQLYHNILECTMSSTGVITLKVERSDHKKVILNNHHLNLDLTTFVDGIIRPINSTLERLAEEKLTAAKAAAAKSTPASTGLFSASAAKAFHAEIAEAVAKAQQAPRAKL